MKGGGRLSYDKDFILLIKSWRVVRNQKDATLCFLGEGSQCSKFMKYARQLQIEK